MENIKLLVQEEGRSARNLVAFNVPVIETQCDSNVSKIIKKPPTSPRSLVDLKKEDSLKCCKRSRDSSQSGSRIRSASTGRDKKSELHARYWAFLFGNLQRAVDEIYQTCETDESVTECKEVIMVLDNYVREFRNLINWFKIKWEYETTPPPQRPHSLAWEIRKSSPGKIRKSNFESIFKKVANQSGPINSPICLFLDGKKGYKISKNSQEIPKTLEENKKGDINFKNLVNDEIKKSVENLSSEKSDGHIENLIKNEHEILVKNINTNILKAIPEKSEINQLPACCISSFTNIDIETNEKNENSLTEIVMVDEVCQTDPEKDVDENGPKFRSSSQQTCPLLTGFDINNEKEKKNLNTVEVKHSMQKSVSNNDTINLIFPECNEIQKKPSTLEGKEVQLDEFKIAEKTSMTKTNKSVVSNLTMTKAQPKNLYSLATTNQSKSVTGFFNTTKVASCTKYKSKTVFSVKPSNYISPRQTWSATKSLQSKKLALTTFSTAVTKPKQNQNTVEAKQEGKVNFLTSGSDKTYSNSKQVKEDNTKLGTALKDTLQSTNSKPKNSNSSISLVSSTSGSTEALVESKNKEEDDGWVKVRSRSRFSPATKTGDLETSLSRSASNLKPKGDQKGVSKMSHKTRFYHPSSAVSLPTLAFSTTDFKENVASKKNGKVKVNGETKNKVKENGKSLKKLDKNKTEGINNKKKSNGDKIRKNSNRLLNEKNLNEIVSDYARKEKTENEKNKGLCRKKLDEITPVIVTVQDPMDEEENHFDEEIKKNKETEEMLQKEINELEAADIEVETGDEETDGETTTGTEEELEQLEKKSYTTTNEDFEKNLSPKKQHRYEEILSGMSWADHMDTLDQLEKLVVQDCSKKGMSKDEQMDTLEKLEEFVARHPGRALELHQKLSSPSRRRTMLDTVKRFQARQAKASEKREQLKMAKAQKLRELLKKVDEVKAAKDKLIEDKRQRLEMKLKRAAENRNLHLKEIMRKAHDEEEKLKEIAFINELEAQNKRHDFMTLCQEQEGRLQGIHEERQRKQEEKAAKEAAVEERRKAIEAERQEKLEKMQERQRKRDEQADKKKQEKEKERQELAREKARDRTERLEALHAAQLEAQEELQKKIQQKQEDYARRHEENIEQIRQKALELSILKCSDDVAPRLAPYETQKLCTACNVLIGSEVYLLSHLRGKKHQETIKNQISGKDLSKEEVERYNIKIIVNAPSDKIDSKIVLDRERIKNFKKKCKKIRSRMVSKGEEYLMNLKSTDKLESPNKAKLQKNLKDIEKVLTSQGKGQWCDSAITTLERSLGEINRTLIKQDPQDQIVFKLLNGFSTLNNILQLDMEVPQNMMAFLPQKCFVTTSITYLTAVTNSASNCEFVILSNKIICLLDLLLKRLTILIPDHLSIPAAYHVKSALPTDLLASVIMRVIAKILMNWENSSSLDHSTLPHENFLLRLQDIISYTVSVGIVDKLTRYCKSIRDPIDDNQCAAQFLLSNLELLTSLIARCKTVLQGNEDSTQLLVTLQVTELVGAVSILYGMLLHQGAPPRLIDAIPPTLPNHTITIAVATMKLLRYVAELDLPMFQSILGAEGISLQFRHIASYLIWYCSHDKEKTLLHEVVAVVGYFAVQHRDNQMILQSGSMPTVLQQLCNLPFPYFSNPELSTLLFPTLLACCSDNEENKAILEQEISYSLLEDFLESDQAANHPLILLLHSSKSSKK